MDVFSLIVPVHIIYTYIQCVSIKCFRTFKRGIMYFDDLKSCSNAGLKQVFWQGRWRCVKVLSFHEGNHHFAQGRQISKMAD